LARARNGRWAMQTGAVVLLLAASLILAACGGDNSSGEGGASFAVEASHVHGLGSNPADEALFIATHGGLFRAAADSDAPSRVGEAGYDLMGFTVAGPDRFLASGHPPLAEADSPHLGLVESSDGESWKEISLGGRADFHVLRYSRGTIYGYNGLDGRLMISTDEGASWRSLQVPAPLFDLAVDPEDPTRFLAATEAGLFEGTTGGQWKRRGKSLGLLAWPKGGPLFLVDGEGQLSESEDAGRAWRSRSRLPEAPAVLTAVSANELYAAMPDGTILQSQDGGATWDPRIEP
jgi:hypothetical protein